MKDSESVFLLAAFKIILFGGVEAWDPNAAV